MAVEVLHDGEPKWEAAEHCCLCKTKTRFWYLANDVALCESCASTSYDSDIPCKRVWLESSGESVHSEGWLCNADKRAVEIDLP